MTPAPVPDASYPPGVTPGGIDDTSALVGAHVGELEDRPVRIVGEQTVRLANGTVAFRDRSVVTLGANWSRFVVVTAQDRRSRPERRSASFTNGTVSFRRLTVGDETTYRRDDRPEEAPEWAVRGRVEGLLDGFERVTVTRTEGPPRFRLEGEFAADAARYDSVENATATAHVDRGGLVHRIRVTYDAANPLGPGRIHVVERVAVRGVGTTAVERPAWLGTAAVAVREALPPGLNRSGVTDSGALADAHLAELAGERVRVTRRLRQVSADARVREDSLRTETGIVGSERETYFHRVEDDRAGVDRTVWSTRSVAVVERAGNGTERYETRPAVGVGAENATAPAERTLTDVLAGMGRARLVYLGSRYRVVADPVRSPGLVVAGNESRGAAFENVSVRLTVDVGDDVREVEIEYRDVANGTRVVETVGTAHLGSSAVPKPAWVPERLAANRSADGA
jgi:hypothetical protein